MTVPATAFIEIGLAELEKKFEEKQGWIYWKEVKEFRGLDDEKLQKLRDLMAGVSGKQSLLSPELILAGYLLGLETARALLATQPNAILHNVEI